MIQRYCHRCEALRPKNHQHSREAAAAKRSSPREEGYDSDWAQVSRDYRRFFPVCMWHEGCLEPASHVHHRDGLGPQGPRGKDWGNLMGLCAHHHGRLEAVEKPRGWAAPGYVRTYD